MLGVLKNRSYSNWLDFVSDELSESMGKDLTSDDVTTNHPRPVWAINRLQSAHKGIGAVMAVARVGPAGPHFRCGTLRDRILTRGHNDRPFLLAPGSAPAPTGCRNDK